VTWLEIDPLPSRLWIRWALRRPPRAAAPYVDLGSRRLVWEGEDESRELSAAAPPEPELTLLPPAAAASRGARDELAATLLRHGVPILVQEIAGDSDSTAPEELFRGSEAPLAATRALDLLALMLAGAAGLARLAALSRPPGRLWVVVPLLPGIVATGEDLDDWLEELTRLHPDAVVGVAPALEPLDRRRLVDHVGAERFDAIFHGRARAESELARAASAFGLPALPERPPLPGMAPRAARNRELATLLAEAGDLEIRVGDSEVEGSALLAAARHLERTSFDVAGLAREGNLAPLEWLAPAARRMIEAAARGEAQRALEPLRDLWRGPVA
jgi:hypothetical protein